MFIYSFCSVTDLCTFIKASFTPAIEVEEIQYNLNVKDWLRTHLAGNFANHSKPLWFEFSLENDHAAMRYKMWHPDPWEPTGEGLYCLKVRKLSHSTMSFEFAERLVGLGE